MILGELPAVLLAAGRGRRMGGPKALLTVEGRPLIADSLAVLRRAGITRAAVVVGPDADAVRALVRGPRVAVVRNDAPERGPFSSLVLGLTALRDEAGSLPPGAFILPVDVPCPRADVLAALASRAESPGVRAAVPVAEGRGGHPVVLTAEGIERVLTGSLRSAEARLDRLLHSWGAAVVRVPVADRSVLVDLNTPADYAAFLRASSMPDTRVSSDARSSPSGAPAIAAHERRPSPRGRSRTR